MTWLRVLVSLLLAGPIAAVAEPAPAVVARKIIDRAAAPAAQLGLIEAFLRADPEAPEVGLLVEMALKLAGVAPSLRVRALELAFGIGADRQAAEALSRLSATDQERFAAAHQTRASGRVLAVLPDLSTLSEATVVRLYLNAGRDREALERCAAHVAEARVRCLTAITKGTTSTLAAPRRRALMEGSLRLVEGLSPPHATAARISWIEAANRLRWTVRAAKALAQIPFAERPDSLIQGAVQGAAAGATPDGRDDGTQALAALLGETPSAHRARLYAWIRGAYAPTRPGALKVFAAYVPELKEAPMAAVQPRPQQASNDFAALRAGLRSLKTEWAAELADLKEDGGPVEPMAHAELARDYRMAVFDATVALASAYGRFGYPGEARKLLRAAEAVQRKVAGLPGYEESSNDRWIDLFQGWVALGERDRALKVGRELVGDPALAELSDWGERLVEQGDARGLIALAKVLAAVPSVEPEEEAEGEADEAAQFDSGECIPDTVDPHLEVVSQHLRQLVDAALERRWSRPLAKLIRLIPMPSERSDALAEWAVVLMESGQFEAAFGVAKRIEVRYEPEDCGGIRGPDLVRGAQLAELAVAAAEGVRPRLALKILAAMDAPLPMLLADWYKPEEVPPALSGEDPRRRLLRELVAPLVVAGYRKPLERALGAVPPKVADLGWAALVERLMESGLLADALRLAGQQPSASVKVWALARLARLQREGRVVLTKDLLPLIERVGR